MPTLRFFGREFETSINVDEMTGEEFRDFMDEVIRRGLKQMEVLERTEKEMANWSSHVYGVRIK